jgi:hypothetical protein
LLPFASPFRPRPPLRLRIADRHTSPTGGVGIVACRGRQRWSTCGWTLT